MLKTIGLCILIFTIFGYSRQLLKRLDEGVDILCDLFSLFRDTLEGVKSYMKPICTQIEKYSTPLLDRNGITNSLLTRNTGEIKRCELIPHKTRDVLCEYIQSYGVVDYELEVLRLQNLVNELAIHIDELKVGVSKKRKLYTTLSASLSFALIIFVI